MSDHRSRAEAEIPATHYLGDYNGKGRFISYWHQIDEVLKRDPQFILEVGIGNQFLADFLRNTGKSIITADINPALLPDVVSSIDALPFADQMFDMVISCEVLEHLPLASLKGALQELHRVTSKWAVLSVPNCTRCYCLQVPIPKVGLLRRQWELPAPRNHALIPDHSWEIGHAGVSEQQLVEYFRQTGFTVEVSYRVFEHPYHHFFVLAREQHTEVNSDNESYRQENARNGTFLANRL